MTRDDDDRDTQKLFNEQRPKNNKIKCGTNLPWLEM